MSTIDSTLITGEDVLATHFSSQARAACTLMATSFCSVAYVIELPAQPETESPVSGQRYGTVTIGTMTVDGFVGRTVRQGLIRFSPAGTDLMVNDKDTGYLLMHATWITAVAYPA